MSCWFSVDFLVSLVFGLMFVGVLFAFLFDVVLALSWCFSLVFCLCLVSVLVW